MVYETYDLTLCNTDFDARPDVWDSLIKSLKLPKDTTFIDVNITVNEYGND